MAAWSPSIESFVPYIELPALRDGTLVQLRETGGKITVLVTLHSAQCRGCREYLDSLSPISSELDTWDARLLVVVPGPVRDAQSLHPPAGRLLCDERSSIADPGSASVVVADRYGQIFDVARSGPSHELPGPRELAEWLKYIGTLCPE